MGYISACEIRQYLSENDALIWHLRHNHFPSINLIFLPAIREALSATRNGESARRIMLPTGKVLTVAQIVEEVHLHAFLDCEEDA